MPTGVILFRIAHVRHTDQAYFGHRAASRFDAPAGSFGVCYLGTTLDCCFLEVFSPRRHPRSERLFLPTSTLSEYVAATARALRPLRLAFLADDGLAQLAIDQRVTAGDDYSLSQAWAAAIHQHASAVDGIFYATRHHNQLYAVALFDRSSSALQFTRWGTLGDRSVRDLWVEAMRVFTRFEVDLIDDA